MLKEIYKPMQIDVDGNHLLVSQLSTVYIYSLENFQLKNKFGKEGEGPQEFKGYALLNVQPQFLLINSMGKLSFFNKDGTKTENHRAEFFIFDIQGKLLKTTMLPLVDRLPATNFPDVIKYNKLYRLVENQDTEMMELYVCEID